MEIMNKYRTRFAVALVVVVALLVLIVIALLSNNEDENGGDGGDGETGAEAAPVTIIIVDDFSSSLSRLAAELPAAPFEQAASRIRDLDFYQERTSQQSDVEQQAQQAYEPGSIELGQGPGDDLLAELTAIVDDLNGALDGAALERVNEVLQRDASDTNCAITSEGTAFFETDGTAFFETDGTAFFETDGTGQRSTAHGLRVQRQVETLLSTYASGADITVETIDTEGFDIEVVIERLAQKIVEIRSEDPERQIVVNMSFAVIPCEAVADLAVYDRLMAEFAPDLAANLEALRNLFAVLVNQGPFRRDLVGDGTFDAVFCSGVLDEYEAAQTLCDPGENAPIVLVAATGNGRYSDAAGATIGQDFPYYPAAWGEVIAVTASDSAEDFITPPGPRAGYANAGLMMMPGVWQVTDTYVEVGTSFAAPRYSVMVALNLAGVSDQDIGCGMGNVPAAASPFDWLTAPPPASDQDQPPC